MSENKVQNSPPKKKKGDRMHKVGKKKTLQTFFARMAPKIIQYTRKISDMLKTKHSHESLLFPRKNIKPQTEAENYNQSLIKEYKSKTKEWYEFYLSKCNIYIDNHLITFFKEKPSIPLHFNKPEFGNTVCFGEFISMDKNNKVNQRIFLGTDYGYILFFNLQNKNFSYLKVLPHDKHEKLMGIYIYENFIVVSTQNSCILCYLHPEKQKIKKLFSERVSEKFMRRCQFIVENDQFFIFLINDDGLFRLKLKEGLLNNTSEIKLIFSSPEYNHFTNLKIHCQSQRILITVSCTKELLVLSHHVQESKTSILRRMPNPTIPPERPKAHIYGCIEYFSHQSEDEENYLLIGVTFTERLYFIRVWNDYCQVSKRAKFRTRILKLIQYKKEAIIIIFRGQDIENKPNFFQVKIILCLTKDILSFHSPFNTSLVDRFQFFTMMKKENTQDKFRLSVILFGSKEILFLTDRRIARIAFNDWKEIYLDMRTTEHLQLLHYLILLKRCKSPIITKPKNFASLENFFPTQTSTMKQILLEYYYLTDQKPPSAFMIEIQTEQPELLIPFILQHKIQNLEEDTKEILVEYYRNKDQRIVEELIIGGTEHGWEIAVKKGWIRALRKMVEMGMEIDFPLLKISSFIIPKLKELEQQNEEEKAESVTQQIQNYCLQIIDYSLLALDCFLLPEDIHDSIELKQFLLTLLKEDIFDLLIKFQPVKSAKLISHIFIPERRMELIDTFSLEAFLNCHRTFKAFSSKNLLNISEIIFSHISETYRMYTQKKNIKEHLKILYKNKLFIEHARLIKLKMNPESQMNFEFIRGYMMEMLVSLVENNNKNVKKLLKDEKLPGSDEEIFCYIQDFLVKIWLQIKILRKNQENIEEQPLTHIQIKQYINVVEQANNSNAYLLIVMMEDLPLQQFCSKILRKFLSCENKLIQERIFPWLHHALTEEFEFLGPELIINLRMLIEIDKHESKVLLQKFYQNKQKQIIRKIDNDPLLQLEYVEMVIRDIEQLEEVEEYYTNLHLKLLITEQPQRVIEVLEEAQTNKKIKYDLHEALKYSQQIDYSEKNKVQTYLYERIGEVEKCIRSLLKDLEEIMWEFVNSYERSHTNLIPNEQNDEEEQEEYDFLESKKKNKQISVITDILMKKKFIHKESESLALEEQFSLTFNELINLVFRQPIKRYQYIAIPLSNSNQFLQDMATQKLKNKRHYMKIISSYFGKIVVEAFEHGYLEYFIRWLIQMEEKISLNQIKKYLIIGYAKILSQNNLLVNITEIDKNVLLYNIQSNLELLENSIHSEGICSICESDFSSSGKYNEEALLFNCGHLFHKNCIEEDENGQDYCWECIFKDQIKAMIDHVEISLVQTIKKYCMKKMVGNVIVDRKEKKEKLVSTGKKRMNRMGLFDKKLASLENQIQIIDTKLTIMEYYSQIQKKAMI